MADGFINVLKPPGLTSHDVVSVVRRRLRQKRVGHAGTLDPIASGVLVVAVGRATRLIQYLRDEKTYRGEITFGMSTSTLDAGGGIVYQAPRSVGRLELERVLARFRGDIQQVPPMVSAVHHQGKRLYELARAGVEVERRSRPVHIDRLEIVSFMEDACHPRALIECTCSAGTYVRVLAADIGEALGCGAYLSFLLRTASGAFEISASVTLEELEEAIQRGTSADWLLPPEAALKHLPSVELETGDARRFLRGQAIPLPAEVVVEPGKACAVHAMSLAFLGVGRWVRRQHQDLIQPEVVFN